MHTPLLPPRVHINARYSTERFMSSHTAKVIPILQARDHSADRFQHAEQEGLGYRKRSALRNRKGWLARLHTASNLLHNIGMYMYLDFVFFVHRQNLSPMRLHNYFSAGGGLRYENIPHTTFFN